MSGAGVNHHGGGGVAGAPATGPNALPAGQDNVSVSNPFDDVSPSPPPRSSAGNQYAQPYGQSGPPRPPGML